LKDASLYFNVIFYFSTLFRFRDEEFEKIPVMAVQDRRLERLRRNEEEKSEEEEEEEEEDNEDDIAARRQRRRYYCWCYI